AGKALALTALLAIVALIGGGLVLVLVPFAVAAPLALAIVVTEGVVALPPIVVLTVVLALRLRARGALVPILALPMLVPHLVAAWMTLEWYPPDAAVGNVVRILYVHVVNAWLAYLAFVVVFLASVAYLWPKDLVFHAIAVASAEIGVLFTGLTLVPGSIWADPTWGVWWSWEPRLITTAVMF